MDLILGEICISAGLSLVGTVTALYFGISFLDKDAKEQGLSEKGYNFGSVAAGAVIGFVTFFFLIFYELFLKSGR